MLYDFMFEVRSRGIDVVRIGSYIDLIFSSLNKPISNHVITISCADALCSDKMVCDYTLEAHIK